MKIISGGRKICLILEWTAAILFLFFAATMFSSEYSDPVIGYGSIICAVFLILVCRTLDSTVSATVPILLNTVFVTIISLFILFTPIFVGENIVVNIIIVCMLYAVLVAFSIIAYHTDRFRTASGGLLGNTSTGHSRNVMKFRSTDGESSGNVCIHGDDPYSDKDYDSSRFRRIFEPRVFGILCIFFGLAYLVSNLMVGIANGVNSWGDVLPYALFCIYGVYVVYKEMDDTSWERYKMVNNFIIIFGLAYVLMGLMGGEGAFEDSSTDNIIVGILIMGLAFYMTSKVYRMSKDGRRPLSSWVIYGIIWLILILFLALFCIGVIIGIPSLFDASTYPSDAPVWYPIANAVIMFATFMMMGLLILYYVTYCRPGQMSYEVEMNEDLYNRAHEYLKDGEYTYTDALKDSHESKKIHNFVSSRIYDIEKAYEKYGYSLDYDVKRLADKLIRECYPKISYKDADRITDKILEASSIHYWNKDAGNLKRDICIRLKL